MPMMSMLIASPPTLAQAAENDVSLTDGLSLTLVGMTVVFAALILVGAMIGLLKLIAAVESIKDAAEAATQAAKAASRAVEAIGRRASTPAPAAPQTSEPTPSAATGQPAGRVDPRTLAIIAAAAATVVGGQVRVRNVEFIRRQGSGGWGARGRVGIQTSHNLQNRNR